MNRSRLAKWQLDVADVVSRVTGALHAEDIVLGGGNVNKLEELPAAIHAGHNANAFQGAFGCGSTRLNGRHTGTTDIPLTENGRSVARHVEAASRPTAVRACPDEPFAAGPRDLRVGGSGRAGIQGDLRECNYGDCEGLTRQPWFGKPKNIPAGQRAFAHRAQCARAAGLGQYTRAVESGLAA